MTHPYIQTFFTTKYDGDMRDSRGNRVRFLENHGISDTSVVIMNQVHGDTIVRVDDTYTATECDGLITNQKGKALFVRVADCIPVLLYDPVRGVIAAVHSGREGVFKGILRKTIERFVSDFQSLPSDIIVEFGPSAQSCCYEVGSTTDAYLNFVREHYGNEFIFGLNIDLPAIAKNSLLTPVYRYRIYIFHLFVLYVHQKKSIFLFVMVMLKVDLLVLLY